MNQEILQTIKEKGILLGKDVFDAVKSLDNSNSVKIFLDQVQNLSQQKMITKQSLNKDLAFIKQKITSLDGEDKKIVENVFVKLGFSLEIETNHSVEIAESEYNLKHPKDKRQTNSQSDNKETQKPNFKIFYADTIPNKKLELKDFVGNIRARYQAIQRILMERPELNNLSSIGKLSSDRANISIIGIISEKRITKNKNLMVKFEDLTGTVQGIIRADNQELFEKASDSLLDDIVGVRASGNRDMLFIHDIIYPDSFKSEKTSFKKNTSIAFISDIHAGSDRHLTQSLQRFLDWINSNDPIANTIEYLFIVGDNVDGVGIFPGQENVLKYKSMEEQYHLLASYLKQIPKRITMFMCPGQHDATRVAEPQPVISKKYAPELYEIENLILVTNPTMVKLYESENQEKEFRVLMYHGASIHTFINEIKPLRLMKAHKTPAKAVREMLKRRHLAPVHGIAVYIPNPQKDALVIQETPDVLCTGEVHRLDIENYHGTIIITGSCWQAQTPFEEKVGNIPDPAKVPVLNLKSRELKILDFGVEEEINKDYNK